MNTPKQNAPLTIAMALLATSQLLVACGPTEAPADNSDATPGPAEQTTPAPQDMGMDAADMPDAPANDGTPDMPDTPDMPETPDMPACEPEVETCEASACGVIEDGCGGVLDCGECACDAQNMPTDPTCGPCGLGYATCDGDGQVECTLPPLPGIDQLSCDAVVFVNAAAASGGDGSALAPYSALEDAIADSDQVMGQRVFVITSAGEHTLSDTWRLRPGHSIIGGYASSPRGPVYTPGVKSLVRVEASVGMIADALTDDFLIEGLDLSSEVGESARDSSIGLALIDIPTARVSLRHLDVRAAEGVEGLDGGAGAPGAAGLDGGTAGSPIVERDAPPTRGEAGLNPDCPTADGGRGAIGKPALVSNGQDGNEGDPAAAGTPGGAGAKWDAPSVLHPDGRGQDGEAGVIGVDGQDADPIMIDGALGMIVDGHFEHAGNGAAGEDGFAGPGGGGGGGGYSHNGTFPGGSGGGGGAGGCGGLAGEGGEAGGSSIALLVKDSPNVSIVDATFTASAGGAGGHGGLGGAGGEGGEGGTKTGAMATREDGSSTLASAGGDGGAGGAGGEGGAGSGGVGGHSLGAYCEGASLAMSEVTFAAGAAGAGGQVPTSGQASADGVSRDEVGCAPQVSMP